MALLFCDGFDKYGPANSNSTAVVALLTAGEWTSAAATLNVVASLSATGQALVLSPLATSLGLVKTLSASYSRLIGGFRFASTLGGVGGAGLGFGDANTLQCTISINAAGTISLRTGAIAGTALATSSTSITANSTHYLEWDITFGTSAAYQVWLDGVSVFSGTGNTRGGTANNSANQLIFTGAGGATQVVTVDDLYLFDATGSTNNAILLNSPRIETTFPISDSAVQFAVGAAILGSSVARTAAVFSATNNFLYLRRFTPTVSGTLNSVTLMPAATSVGALHRGVIYADSAGAPGTLMSVGANQTGVTSGVAKDLPLSSQSLVAGTSYWLGFMGDTSLNMSQLDANATGYRAAATFGSGAPGTAPGMTAGQGSFLLWGNLSGITAANFSEVSQQPPAGQYSYLADSTVGHEDLYGFNPMTATPGSVHAVALKGYCQRSDTGAKTVSLRIKSGGTDSGGSITGQSPATTYGWLASYFPTDPNTGGAWTGAALDAATAGIKVDS